MTNNNLSWPAGVRATQLKSARLPQVETLACVLTLDNSASVTWVARTPAGHDNFGCGVEIAS
jgi:hypothetical protein